MNKSFKKSLKDGEISILEYPNFRKNIYFFPYEKLMNFLQEKYASNSTFRVVKVFNYSADMKSIEIDLNTTTFTKNFGGQSLDDNGNAKIEKIPFDKDAYNALEKIYLQDKKEKGFGDAKYQFTQNLFHTVINPALKKNKKSPFQTTLEDFPQYQQELISSKLKKLRNSHDHLEKISSLLGKALELCPYNTNDIKNREFYGITFECKETLSKEISDLLEDHFKKNFQKITDMLEINEYGIRQSDYGNDTYRFSVTPKNITAHEKIEIKKYLKSSYNLIFP